MYLYDLVIQLEQCHANNLSSLPTIIRLEIKHHHILLLLIHF